MTDLLKQQQQQDNNSEDLSEDLAFRRMLSEETMKSGSLRSLLSFLGFAVFFILLFLSRFTVLPDHELNAVVFGEKLRFWIEIILLPILFYELLIWRLLKAEKYKCLVYPSIYVLAFIEITFITLILCFVAHVKDPTYTLSTPAILLYGLVTFSFPLFLNVRLCIFAGIIAAVEFFTFASFLTAMDVNDKVAMIPSYHNLVKSIILLLNGVAASFIAWEIKRRTIDSFNRISALLREKSRAQQVLTESIRQHAEQLEVKVTERTAELKKANDTKDRFFSIIAHDLRGPIGGISVIFNEMIDSGCDLDDQLLSSVRQTSKTTYELLENLLTWARSQGGQIKLSPCHITIHELLISSSDVLRSALDKKEITLNIKADVTLHVYADRAMISTVIRNLLNNAVKFSNRGGRITITAEKQQTEVLISVSDTGVGIPDDVATKLFHVGEATTTRGTEHEAGSGLGLILVKDFVERNHGKIGVNSEVGKGSLFWFTVPPGQQSKTMKSQKALTKTLSGINVLLVEDNRLHEQTSLKVLTDYDMNPTVARTGTQALQQAKDHQFDLILMDIDLPDLDGTEVTQQLRSTLAPCPKIIALSAYSNTEIEEAVNIKFDGYLNKPLSRDELLIAIGKDFGND